MKISDFKQKWLGRAALILALAVNTAAYTQPCNEFYDFTTATGWTQVGSGVAVTTGATGKITATAAACGGSQRYVYKTLSTPLGNNWTCDFDFVVTGNVGAAHSLVSFTDCSVGAHGFWTGATFNYMYTNCIEAYIIAPAGSTNPANWQLCAQTKIRGSNSCGTTTTTPI